MSTNSDLIDEVLVGVSRLLASVFLLVVVTAYLHKAELNENLLLLHCCKLL